MKNNAHHGSSFDDFLDEEGILAEVEAAAIKRVIAHELNQSLSEARMNKSAFAEAMMTSRAAVDRLLDSDNTSVTLSTLVNAALAVGKQLRVTLVDRAVARAAAVLPLESKASHAWPKALQPEDSTELADDEFETARQQDDEGMAFAA